MADGPVIIGYDGSQASDHAIGQAAQTLRPRRALVVVVWEAGLAYELAEGPAIPAAPLDLRVPLELDEAAYEGARRTAERGAELARQAGFEAEGMAVADELTVAETLVRVARESDSPAIVVGAHGHGAVGELLMGSTSRDVVRRAERPVLVVRMPTG